MRQPILHRNLYFNLHALKKHLFSSPLPKLDKKEVKSNTALASSPGSYTSILIIEHHPIGLIMDDRP